MRQRILTYADFSVRVFYVFHHPNCEIPISATVELWYWGGSGKVLLDWLSFLRCVFCTVDTQHSECTSAVQGKPRSAQRRVRHASASTVHVSVGEFCSSRLAGLLRCSWTSWLNSLGSAPWYAVKCVTQPVKRNLRGVFSPVPFFLMQSIQLLANASIITWIYAVMQ